MLQHRTARPGLPPPGLRASRRRRSLLLVGAPLAIGLLAGSLQGQERSLVLERFNQVVEVRRDGSIDVTETLRARFEGSWNGIERTLSLRHETADGVPARLDLDIGEVTDGAGNPLQVESERGRNRRDLRIWVPDAENATRTVVLRYRVDNALRFFDSTDDPGGIHDELYWNVTGNEWRVPIRQASIRVVLPESVEGVQAWAYTGPAGAAGRDATVEVEENTVDVETTDPLDPGEGLTVSVTWPPGAVARPTAAAAALGEARRYWPVALPFLVLFGAFLRWRRRGRDPARRAIAVQYEPLDGLSPAEVGTLVDHEAEMHDILSTLVDLAVRGYLRIEEKEEKRLFGLTSSTEYVFRLLRPESEWSGLQPHERRFLQGIFGRALSRTEPPRVAGAVFRLFKDPLSEWEDRALGGGEEGEEDLPSVELSDLENRFYTAIPGIQSAIYDRLRDRGLYDRRPDKVKAGWQMGALVTLIAGVAAAVASANGTFFVADPFVTGFGFGVSALIVLVFSFVMPARTLAGARAREAALGFREFLEKVEEPRFRRMITSPDLFEKYLPFAMAFRVENRWSRAFEDLVRTPPDWYRGRPGSTFQTRSFTRNLSDLSGRASQVMSSSPSSSSSGSGGGGSSGGGSGGGGGGGF